MIPKIIWQTHENKYENLPLFQKNIINTWKNLNPDCEHRYLNAKEREKVVKDYSKTLYGLYEKLNGMYQADIWRIIATYEHGGVYADMDSICIMPLDDMINTGYTNQDMICTSIGFQAKNNINCSNFATIKNSNVMEEIVEKVATGLFKNSSAAMWTTFSNTVKQHKDNVYFQDSYFLHSKDFKVQFNGNTNILYNKKIINYLDLCKINEWSIH